MAGIPASGKSRFVDAAIEQGIFPRNAFLLDPDRVMNAIAGYQHDFQNLGAQGAFERWEMPARALAYAMLDEAVTLRADIIKDMGCARMENFEKLKTMKQAGYRICMSYIDCPVELALRRAAARPRHTPESMIRERAESLAALLPLYRSLADEFTVVPVQVPVQAPVQAG